MLHLFLSLASLLSSAFRLGVSLSFGLGVSLGLRDLLRLDIGDSLGGFRIRLRLGRGGSLSLGLLFSLGLGGLLGFSLGGGFSLGARARRSLGRRVGTLGRGRRRGVRRERLLQLCRFLRLFLLLELLGLRLGRRQLSLLLLRRV